MVIIVYGVLIYGYSNSTLDGRGRPRANLNLLDSVWFSALVRLVHVMHFEHDINALKMIIISYQVIQGINYTWYCCRWWCREYGSIAINKGHVNQKNVPS